MRILFLTPGCFDKGGISRYTRYQIRALRTIFGASNIHAMSLLGPGADSIEEPFEVDFHAAGTRRIDKARFVAHATGAALARRPDIILAAHVNLSAAALALGSAARAATILNIYGLEVWSGMRRDAAFGLRSVKHVIADCHFTARYVEDNGLRSAGATTVIWDCVDLAKFSPRAPRPEVVARYRIPDPTTGINLLSFGRMTTDSAHKGYERLLEVFAKVAPRAPSLRLIFAGRGQLGEVLKERAARMSLGARVTFTGGIHEDDLPDVYRSGHIFSLVSDRGPWRGEGIPLTPLEGAACGLPLLVGNQDGSQEAVIDGVNGYTLDPFDLATHAAKILHLAQDAGARSAMAAAARERAEREFSYDRFVDKHRALFATQFADRTARLTPLAE